MKHMVTITQLLVTTVEVDAKNEQEAYEVGNRLLNKDAIPLSRYEMIEATVKAKQISNVLPFPMRKEEKRVSN